MADPLSVTASLIAVLQLSNAVVKYLKDIKSGSSDRTQLRDELRNATCLIQMLQDRVEDADYPTNASLQPAALAALVASDGPIGLFKRTLEAILHRLAPPDRLGRRIQCLTWPFHKQQVRELVDTLERLKTYFNLILQDDLSTAVKNANFKLDELAKQVDKLDIIKRETQRVGDIARDIAELNASDHAERKAKILAWISPMTYVSKQAEVLEGVQQGTGQWFLQDSKVAAWINGDIQTLWCYGIPGAGKTKLISLIIQHLHERPLPSRATLSYIYCDYGQIASQTDLNLLSSLLVQLFQRSDDAELPSEVIDLYTLHQKYNTRPTTMQIVDVLKKTCSLYKKVYIVVDALDECSNLDELTLGLVSNIQSLGTNVCLLCTSRSSTAFERYFEGYSQLRISAKVEDIRKVLKARIPLHNRLSSHIKVDESLEEEIISTIIEESQGMFLLATLHLESLSRKITRKEVRTALRTLPRTLDATYAQAMLRIRGQANEDAELAEEIIFWIVCARRALTVQELRHIFAVKYLEEHTMLDIEDLPADDVLTEVCRGLIVVDEDRVHVRPVHYTAQQYLQRAYPESLIAARLDLTKLSLTYMTLPNLGSGVCDSDSAMIDRLEDYPFISYAAQYWGSEIHDLDSSEIWNYLKDFLSNDAAIAIANQVMCLPARRYKNWSQQYPRNVPALVLTASFNAPDVLRRLVSENHDLEGKGSDHETALIRASTYGLNKNVETLLDVGASINATELSGENALHRAATYGNKILVETLLTKGANLNATAAADWTPLMSATTRGEMEIVQALVMAGADLSRTTSWGDSALSLATRNGFEAIANYLADAGAILPNSAAGRRASIVASRKGLQTLVRRLTMDYDAVIITGLQRQHVAGKTQLAGLVETDEEHNIVAEGDPSLTSQQNTQDPDDLSELVEGKEYTKGFERRYATKEKLGQGHSADVYLCASKVTGVLYAVKIYNDSRKAKFISKEIDVTSVLHHGNMIQLIDLVVDDQMKEIYLVQELAAEGDLFNLIVSQGKLTEAEARKLFRQLFNVLSFLHDLGWIHRDIKAENLLLADKDLTLKLADFDLAVNVRNEDGTNDVAPEIIQQSSLRSYTFPVDIWSAGVVLYICLCGFPPFSDELTTPENPYNLAQQIKIGRFDYPSPYWDPVGDPALNLIDCMLTVDPSQRFNLQQCLEHEWTSETV